MSDDTKLALSLECDDLIDGLDKSAAQIEKFSKQASSAIANVDKRTKALSENERTIVCQNG